jgi:DNA-binding transcriptional LysR family regulator
MLDPRLLRAFAAIADAGSFTAAADRLSMTQSTISQQLARLESAVGQVLIERAARPIRPTAAGERLLAYARRILALQEEAQAALGDPAGTVSLRIGVPEDLVSAPMAQAFADFARRHREIHLDVTAGLSRDLVRRYRAGELDIAIAKEPAASPDHRASFPEVMAWFESADAPAAWPDPVPLVAFSPGGLYREAMFERMEQERLRWYIAFTGNSLHNVLVAVAAGLGLSLLPRNAVAGYRVQRCEALGAEPPIAVSIYAREGSGPLSELVEQMGAVLAARSGRLADLGAAAGNTTGPRGPV